jgi:hypothetical protein
VTFDPWEKFGIATCLHGMAITAAQQGRPERPATLLGAVHKLREQLGGGSPPFEREEYVRDDQQVRSALGETRFLGLLAQELGMTADHALAYIHRPEGPATGSAPSREVPSMPNWASLRAEGARPRTRP